MSPLESSDSLRAALLSIPERVPLDRLDRLWIFPPKDLTGRETGLLVLALLPTESFPDDHRQILTLRYEAESARARAAPALTLTEQAWAPADRMDRVIRGVVSRLEEEQEPEEHFVAGDEGRWSDVLRHHGLAVVDPIRGE